MTMKEPEIREKLPAPEDVPAAEQKLTPQEIRNLVCNDLRSVTDPQLLGLVLAIGARGRTARGRAGKSRTMVGLAEVLWAQAGGGLADLVHKTCAHELDLSRFGIGKSIGGRLIAAMTLADRWGRGFEAGEDLSFFTGDGRHLAKLVCDRERRPTEGDLIALVLGTTWPAVENAMLVLDAFGSTRSLIATLCLDDFESSYKSNRIYFRLPDTAVEIELIAFCRLLAAVELARRYRGLEGSRRRVVLEPGALGLQSRELESLLDPRSPLAGEERQRLIGVLRTHQELTGDFAKLDRMAGDAGTEDYEEAAALHQQFELLRQRRQWQHPAEVLGEPVPYGRLLAIAAARIERAGEPSEGVAEVLARLEKAERESAAPLVAAFVQALLKLRVSRAGAERALAEARRRYQTRRVGRRALGGDR